MKKSLFSLLLLAGASLYPLAASAYDFSAENGEIIIYYNKLTNTTCEVTSGRSLYVGSVNIPESVSYEGNTYSVTSLGEHAFSGCYALTSVSIPNSVTSIGEETFHGCSGLTSFYGKYASDDNRCLIKDGCLIAFARLGLTEYSIPTTVASIGDAFDGCSGLTSVTIPNSVISIGNYAFCGCSGLTSVTIPNSVTSIANNAFQACSGMTSVSIPNTVTSIGDYAFYECRSLTSVTIPDSIIS